MNPIAVIFWGITTITGYLITGTAKGAVIGLLVGLVISFLASLKH